MSLRTATLMAGLMLAAPAAAYAAPATHIAATEKTSSAPEAAAQVETTNYAEREAADPQVASYEGGQTVVIAMSGGALVVLLILLLLL
jgi:hypothetical protein